MGKIILPELFNICEGKKNFLSRQNYYYKGVFNETYQ